MLGKTFAEKQAEQNGRNYKREAQNLRKRNAELESEATFLLNRLDDLCFDDDDAARDFNCHVAPSMSRLRKLVSK